MEAVQISGPHQICTVKVSVSFVVFSDFIGTFCFAGNIIMHPIQKYSEFSITLKYIHQMK